MPGFLFPLYRFSRVRNENSYVLNIHEKAMHAENEMGSDEDRDKLGYDHTRYSTAPSTFPPDPFPPHPVLLFNHLRRCFYLRITIEILFISSSNKVFYTFHKSQQSLFVISRRTERMWSSQLCSFDANSQ